MALASPWIVGIDVGGANLKYAARPASTDERLDASSVIAKSRFFPMWTHYDSLASEITHDLQSLAPHQPIERIAVTMTGELADCFVDRAEGVRHIVAHVCEAAADLRIAGAAFYGVDGRFYSSDEAPRAVDRLAAGNWHALASFVGKSFCHDGILIDIGSTTTDIIPLKNGRVATTATTDHERLREGSLVYIGGERTPVAALRHQVLHDGQPVSVMKEWFATMDDVRILLGLVKEDPHDLRTADGKPRSIAMAVNRLARMIGLDRRHFAREDGIQLATQVHRTACQHITLAMDQIRSSYGVSDAVVISGHAPDLIDLPPTSPIINLREILGEEVSRCAPAYAVAEQLRSEGQGIDQPCDA